MGHLSGEHNEQHPKQKRSCTSTSMPIYFVAILIIILVFCSSGIITQLNPFTNIANKRAEISTSSRLSGIEVLENFRQDSKESSPAVAATSTSSENIRLPTNLKPLSYNLVIKLYLPHYVKFPASKNLTTEGEVIIEMVVIQATNRIVLNMNSIILLFDGCEAHSNRVRLTITSISIEDHLDRVTFVLAETLHTGQQVSLKVKYSGFINDGMDGIYQDLYNDSQGNIK
ncbi:hypothetical protein Y032_0012g1912 [Ancylostoma ceylanicum]|uniref:Aminopeptidase N-like N-terminal domain-containing protein n=1 Tax=Ancylostoma ceylanicum TaxID=53326 RepID=A0A016VDG8_9BILA|nr:hypothetical protein Y032_0012g1912 [Ancylostoma ceylanicum]